MKISAQKRAQIEAEIKYHISGLDAMLELYTPASYGQEFVDGLQQQRDMLQEMINTKSYEVYNWQACLNFKP